MSEESSSNAYDRLKLDEHLEPVVENECGLKVHLLHPSFRDKEVMKLHDLVMKELTLSYIPDTELASIYAGKMDCIESWLSMGFSDLAKSRLTRMLFRLQLLRSVQGNEGMLMHGTMSTSVSMERGEIERSVAQEEAEQQSQGGNPIMKLIRRRR